MNLEFSLHVFLSMYHVCTCACKDCVLDFTVSVIIINVLQVHCVHVVISSCACTCIVYLKVVPFGNKCPVVLSFDKEILLAAVWL